MTTLTCETVVRDEILERREDGFLDADVEVPLSEHLARCGSCRARADAVRKETHVLRGAARLALARAVRPARRRRRVLSMLAAAAVLLLLAYPLWIATRSPSQAPPPATQILDLDLRIPAGQGMFAPPCFARCLLDADLVVVVRIESVATEERRVRILGRKRETLHGEDGALPDRIRLNTRQGMSELGPHRFPVTKGTDLVLLLARTKDGLRLVTGSTHSTAAVGMLVFLPSAEFEPKTFPELRSRIVGALSLRRKIETTPWKEMGKPLAAALRAKDGLVRELAIDAYSLKILGFVAEFGVGGSLPRPPSPDTLPDVEAALADLVAIRKERIGVISGKAFFILSTTGYANWPVWAAKLDAGDLADDVYEHLRTVAGRAKPAERKRLLAALRGAADGGTPVVRVLASGLLHELGDSSRLSTVLDVEIGKKGIAIVERLKVDGTGPLWPRLRYLSGLAGRTLESREKAREWIATR